MVLKVKNITTYLIVVVKADKKLLTVLFPDGRDGRAFTLKADTMEDLHEWKAALEHALTQAPSASHVMGQNGIFRNDQSDAPAGVDEHRDEAPARPTVLGRPVLLALEDVDGTPSFLEKALRFVEDHGVNTEGILRQAADVDDVEHRIREYEQGKNEFSPTEDAHVIADCLKYFLRELPSSPVPASCCNALLEACRTIRGNRVNAMREAICESFPEPNRRLLQRNNGESSSSSSSQPPQVQPQQQQNANEQDPERHGDTCSFPPAQSGNTDPRSRAGNTVFKSGPLSISSKGLGWTSWKKRWFILTRTSLVFFRSDPSAVQQRGGEVNLTLGGIDLNNSGSVVVKADKKLLTVLFPDGRDGRAFTLKADTMEDLHEWKAALENALTQAPSASHVMGQNGIFRNDQTADAPAGVDEHRDEAPKRPTVLGRPVLLALEDVDGTPSFLEKALRFVEDHGIINTEGILRQAADVDDVEHRIREYEQGRNEFTPTEDAHVIADCLKYFLREMPSSPVPASCCNALLEACRTIRGNRVNAMREAICESFPEPNRRLLQRILMMMLVVASNKNVNRMNTNAVAACMAPLLLRPLLAGDCNIENDFDVGGDGSMQLLQAAAAANHAQAIVITLLEEYDSIFGEGSLSAGLYSDSEESGSETEEGTDDGDDVEHRIREYEQGRNEFTPTEDAHVIADCLKYFLRELPSSPVPASCCNALLEACRTIRGNRVSAMREAICESFPEPNRRLLQRILMMMQLVAANKNVNRMNTNAVAACMAPLLLRPLLAGDCNIENDFDVGGDGSMQLLQAAAAANHAQAIVITLLEEYDSIFGEGSLSAGLYSDSEESGSETEDGTDDGDYDDDEDYDGTQGSGDYTDEEEDLENESDRSYSESEASADTPHDHKARPSIQITEITSSESTPKGSTEPQVPKKLLSSSKRSSLPRHDDARKDENILVKGYVRGLKTEDKNSSTTLSSAPGGSKRLWGRAHGRKNLSMESIDFTLEVEEDDADIERLELTKSELQNRIADEVKNNAVLQASLERRKKALYVRRQALENDVERLQEQLQKERDRKSALEAGLNMSKGNQPIPETTDEKLKKDLQEVAQAEADIANLEHKVDDLENRLGQEDIKGSGSPHGGSRESRRSPEHNAKMKEKQKDTEATSSNVSERSMLKDGQGSARDDEIEKIQDPRSKSSQQSSKLTGMSKRSGTKGEGNTTTTTTTSALSKLSVRLNFLKERRSQIANELSNMDKGRSSGQPSPSTEQNQSVQEPERGTGSNQNQNQDSDSSKLQSPHVLDRGRSDNGGTEAEEDLEETIPALHLGPCPDDLFF
ncbi:hypothetical protein Bca52824_070343 [Brassica carinata]|uniref:Rho GTPase-activating protein REN1-like n=1 Tax=Brassica carinata TaxID=52824 RepID=A0A8X7U302_BRACI|nr:hypothetical protein Bca52824_070343 [Brassica carinata]